MFRALRSLAIIAGTAVVAALCTGASAETETPAKDAAAPTASECLLCRARETVQTSWLNWGLDQRVRWTYARNPFLFKGESNFQDFRTRLWASLKPVDDIQINARLVWQFEHNCKPDNIESNPSSDVPFDLLNITWTRPIDLPITLVVGRQDLKLGDGWLIYEGTPADEFRTFYFDAARLTWDLDDVDTTVDLIYIRNRADSGDHIKPFNNVDIPVSDLNETGAVLYLTNTSQENLQVDGYFIYKHDEIPGNSQDISDIYTFGSRVAGECGEHWGYSSEAAFQFGRKLGASVCGAWGTNNRIIYELGDTMNTDLHGGYEYRAGGRDIRSNFDMLWGRYPQWSLLYSETIANIDGFFGQSSNLHRLHVGAATEPAEDLTVEANYHLLFADRDNLFSSWNGTCKFRGHLLTALLNIRHNKHLASTIRAEMFAPGDYYPDFFNETAALTRYELNFTW